VNLTDDEAANALRAHVAAVAPTASWDPQAVIAAGRRRRTLRATGLAAGACAIVAVAGLAFPAALAHRSSAPPADTTPDAERVELAPGLVAAVGVEGPDGDVLLGQVAGWTARLQPSHMSPGGPTGDPELALEGPATGQYAELASQGGAIDALFGGAILDGDTGAVSTTGEIDPARTVLVLAGTVPLDLADGHVLLYSASGYPRTDGSVTHVVEIPTFRVPESVSPLPQARSPFWVLEVRPPEVADMAVTTARLVFASADGSTVRPICEAMETSCPVAAVPGLADEVREALGR